MYAQVYSEHIRTSEVELFAKIVNGFQLLTIFVNAPSQMFDWVLNAPLVRVKQKLFCWKITLEGQIWKKANFQGIGW